MSQVIVYQFSERPVSVAIPAPDCGLTIEQIAQKDVPQGVAYWIAPATDIPEDRTFRSAWELDAVALGEPHGHGDPKAYWAWVESERLRVEEEERIAEEDRIKELAKLFEVEEGVQE